MKNEFIPDLTNTEKDSYFSLAKKSVRKRTVKILHEKGDYVNKVFNFMLIDSYMQPHRHPSPEKIENMYLLEGTFALFFFDDAGCLVKKIILENGKRNCIKVPAYAWHTYVMLSERVIVYEKMEGFYDPKTWKDMAPWAPSENTPEAELYLAFLKDKAK